MINEYTTDENKSNFDSIVYSLNEIEIMSENRDVISMDAIFKILMDRKRPLGIFDMIWLILFVHSGYEDIIPDLWELITDQFKRLSENPTAETAAKFKSFILDEVIDNGITGAAGWGGGNSDTQEIITGFRPMYHGELTVDFLSISGKKIKKNRKANTENFIIETENGRLIEIEEINKILAGMSVPMKKIFNEGVTQLARINYYKNAGKDINPTVEFSLYEYAKRNGKILTSEDSEINFKRELEKNLLDIEKIKWTAKITKGRNKGDYCRMALISSSRIIKGVIRINFDPDAARYFAKCGIMQYPDPLYLIDNRDENTFSIGNKIAFHNSYDNNYKSGTNNTLSVKNLLKAAPDIKNIDDLLGKANERRWKEKIKRPLEGCLNKLMTNKYLSAWEYRNPITGDTYNAVTSNTLTIVQYSTLMVDFTVINEPYQHKRRERNAEIAVEKANNKPKKKRGRPKKENNG